MLDAFSNKGDRTDEDHGVTNAERARKLFDLPSAEKIVTGISESCRSDIRISSLACEECSNTGIYVAYRKTYLFLCPGPQNRCMPCIWRS